MAHASISLLILNCLIAQAGTGGGGRVVGDPRSADAAAQWVAIAPRAVAELLQPLAEHRVRAGLASAAVVPLEAILKDYPAEGSTLSVRDFSLDIAKRGGGKYILLIGDAKTIPPAREPGAGGASPCATDAVFVRDDGDAIPDRAIGRIPTADPELLKSMIARTIAYENDTKPAGWRRRMTFLAASGGFGKSIDTALDGTVSAFLDRDLPLEFDLRVLRPDPDSPFGAPPENEKSAILDLWNSGSLVSIYAGHGSRHGFHTATALGITRPIFTSADIQQIDVRSGAPFVILFACDNGQFQDVEARRRRTAPAGVAASCFAEALLTNSRGAVAVLAASENSHPYPDLLLAHALNDLFKQTRTVAIGDLVREAKVILERGDDAFRRQVDAFADLFGLPAGERAKLRAFESSLYNLFGDPAVRLRRPELAAQVRAPESATEGSEITIRVAASAPDGASVIITLETTRAALPRAKGFPAANDRVLDRRAGELINGEFAGTLRIPKTRAKRLVVVADVRGASVQAAGAAIVNLTGEKPAAATPSGDK